MAERESDFELSQEPSVLTPEEMRAQFRVRIISGELDVAIPKNRPEMYPLLTSDEIARTVRQERPATIGEIQAWYPKLTRGEIATRQDWAYVFNPSGKDEEDWTGQAIKHRTVADYKAPDVGKAKPANPEQQQKSA